MADASLPTIRMFQVSPDVPPALEPLMELARNLWWVWHPDAVELFRRLDRKLWEDVYHNPVKMLGLISQDRLSKFAHDEGYLAHLKRIHDSFKLHTWAEDGWFQTGASLMHDGGPRLDELGGQASRGEQIEAAGGVFLSGIWVARVAADLFGRLWESLRGII